MSREGPYARYQHERLDLRHEHGNAKYLEIPMHTEENTALSILAQRVREAPSGKVQNTVKKIRRYETGTNTAPDKPLGALLAEMADVVCYLDLLATKYGRDLAGAIAAKFNVVSERQSFPERLPEADRGRG